MKKLILTALSVLLFAGPLSAGWLDDMKLEAEKKLEPVIRDIGAVIGGGQLGPSGTLGFPGAQAGIKAVAASISDDNNLISQNYLILPAKSAGIGLPGNISVTCRGMQYKLENTDEPVTWLGISGRYSVIKDKMLSPLPGITAVAGYNRLSVPDIKVHNISLGAVIGKKLPLISPYFGISYDLNKGLIETSAADLEPAYNFMRLAAGVTLKPIPFTYIDLGASMANGNLGYSGGAGIRF
ncbi:MAG: hypothetical protein PF545_06595 [Elusimicrobia bacterium]|jgi:hypothetical protein|nr:hypothetical protein [Elusimicrobiota bacterium]